MSDERPATFWHNGHEYTFRTPADIKALLIERDEHYAAGHTEEAAAVVEILTYTACRP